MTPREANALLTRAALIDPRMKRTDPNDQAEMAETWSALLHDVTAADAEGALFALMRRMKSGDAAILPGDVLAEVGALDRETVKDLTPRSLEADMLRKLEAAGVSAQDVLDHRDDTAWLNEHFPDRGPTCPRCGGSGETGWAGEDPKQCDLCDGLGHLRKAIAQ